MSGFEDFATWLYASGDYLMAACRVVAFIFVLECASYIVAAIASIGKAVK